MQFICYPIVDFQRPSDLTEAQWEALNNMKFYKLWQAGLEMVPVPPQEGITNVNATVHQPALEQEGDESR